MHFTGTPTPRGNINTPTRKLINIIPPPCVRSIAILNANHTLVVRPTKNVRYGRQLVMSYNKNPIVTREEIQSLSYNEQSERASICICVRKAVGRCWFIMTWIASLKPILKHDIGFTRCWCWTQSLTTFSSIYSTGIRMTIRCDGRFGNGQNNIQRRRAHPTRRFHE